MTQWKKVKIGDVCKIVKGTTGIASAEAGEYPLVVTAEERKTCSTYQFDCEAVCIPLVSSSGHGKKSLNNVHYQSGKFALGTILCAVIPNNPEQLDARFLHQYLQFYKDTVLVPLMKGAANVSLSMHDIATVEIPLPPIEKQRELSALFFTLQENQKKLVAETEKQFEYTKQLRQNILQDAIEGKLTADWRKNHPVIKGDPNYDAEALFEQIQKEKTDKKQKKLPPITAEDKAFDIPEGWKWVRLGEISYNRSTGPFGSMLHKTDYVSDGIPLINPTNIKLNHIDYQSCMMISLAKFEKLNHYALSKNDIILARRGDLSKCGIIDTQKKQICGTGCFFMKLLAVDENFFKLVYQSQKSQQYLLQDSIGQTMSNLNQKLLEKLPFPLPSIAEQKEIVDKVKYLLAKVAKLESQIAERENMAKQLMQSILKDAFGEKTPKRQNDVLGDVLNDALDVALDVALDGAKN